MLLLNCMLVGDGGVISTILEEWKTVALLKKAIKVEKPNDFKDIDADKLQLFLAKTESGAWLSSKDPDMISMRSGGIPEHVKTLLNVEMDPADEIGDVFEGAPTKKTIHVLVV
ncbi:hypothetical protein PHYSODRAFT_368893, partial [Phytophthora sojae]